MTHTLEIAVLLPKPIEEVFAFFADAANLERLTPPELRFEILTPLPIALQSGTEIRYRLRLFGVPFGWRTCISVWDPPNGFVDQQESGPYKLWHHTHSFEAVDEGTLMRDRVRYALPLAPFGEVAHPIVRRQLDRIFSYRTETLLGLFGGRLTS